MKLIKLDDAINVLDECWVDGGEYMGDIHGNIQALPTFEASEDCISRTELLDRMREYRHFFSALDTEPTLKCMGMIEDAPPAVPDRPQGEWREPKIGIETRYPDILRVNKPCFCSVCNRIADHESDFCPNCGADMRGDNE